MCKGINVPRTLCCSPCRYSARRCQADPIDGISQYYRAAWTVGSVYIPSVNAERLQRSGCLWRPCSRKDRTHSGPDPAVQCRVSFHHHNAKAEQRVFGHVAGEQGLSSPGSGKSLC